MTNLRPRSPSPILRCASTQGTDSEAVPPSKRLRLEPDAATTDPPLQSLHERKDFSVLYAPGLYLAPMVRIGTRELC